MSAKFFTRPTAWPSGVSAGHIMPHKLQSMAVYVTATLASCKNTEVGIRPCRMHIASFYLR
jgi:hypothetical protein